MTLDTTSRSKGQRSTCRGRGILWRPSTQLVTIRMPFRSPNQQCWSTEGKFIIISRVGNIFGVGLEMRKVWLQCSGNVIWLLGSLSRLIPGIPAPCGLWSCKNRPTPFPDQMSYRATKPGSVCPVSYPRFLLSRCVFCC